MSRHCTQMEFLSRIYGAGTDSVVDQHLAECSECRAEWEALVSSRQQVLRQSPAVSTEYLAQQRQRIHSYVERSRNSTFFARWSPALAVAGMALFVVLWKLPSGPPAQRVEIAASSDAQLMTEIYRTVYDSEPDVVEPLHGLFESKQ